MNDELLAQLRTYITQYLQLCKEHDADIACRPKTHDIVHLPEQIDWFGSGSQMDASVS